MKKTKALKTNKGITLIALVITIIVMLILVAVTIATVVNGGLFDYAGTAAGDTKNAIFAEQELSKGRIKVDNTWYDSIQDYVDGKESANQGGELTGSDVCEYCEDGIFTGYYCQTCKLYFMGYTSMKSIGEDYSCVQCGGTGDDQWEEWGCNPCVLEPSWSHTIYYLPCGCGVDDNFDYDPWFRGPCPYCSVATK